MSCMEFKSSGPSHTRKLSVVAIVAAVLLQLAAAPFISIFGARCNFMVVLVAVGSVGLDARGAVLLGFFSGLFFELTAPVPVGVMTLLLSVCGYFVSHASLGVAAGFNADSFRLSGIAVSLVMLLYSLAMFFLGIESSFIVSVFAHGLTSAIFNVILCIPFLMLCGRGEQARGFSASPYSRTLRFKQRR